MVKVSGQTSLLNFLTEQIENFYTNRFLLPLNNAWQLHVDGMSKWHVDGLAPQRRFFHRLVKPHLDNENKIVVIISDALRYEAGGEMVERIRHEDRCQAKLEAILSSLPSYTQLGMASLLPQSSDAPLQIVENKTSTVGEGAHLPRIAQNSL